MQGNYDDILTSGIDISDMLVEKENNVDGKENADQSDEAITISRKSSASSLRKSLNSIDSNSAKSQLSSDNKEDGNEKEEMLKELEASSRGKISGSLLLNYFKSAKQSCALAFLVVSFLLTQLLVSVGDISIAYW